MVKWKRDLMLSVGLIVFSVVLFIYAGTFKTNVINIPAAMPDVYMRIWLGLLAILSVLLLIRTLRTKPDEVVAPMWGKLQIFTVVCLLLYVGLLKVLGFRICTILFLMATTTVYCLSDMEEKPKGKKLVLCLAKYLLISLIVMVASDLLFRNVLHCNLPSLSLFN